VTKRKEPISLDEMVAPTVISLEQAEAAFYVLKGLREDGLTWEEMENTVGVSRGTCQGILAGRAAVGKQTYELVDAYLNNARKESQKEKPTTEQSTGACSDVLDLWKLI
jgi:cyanate lyase